MNIRAFSAILAGSTVMFAASASHATTFNVGPADFAATFDSAQTYTFQGTSQSGAGLNSSGIAIGSGITWYGTSGRTTYANSGEFSFGNNGLWKPSTGSLGVVPPNPSDDPLQSVSGYIGYTLGTNDDPVEVMEEDYMVIRFDTEVQGVGFYLNFATDYSDFAPTLEVFNRSGTGQLTSLGDPFDLADGLSTLGGDSENLGFFFGITSDNNDIMEIQLRGAFLSAARMYVNTVPEPEGLVLMLTALGILGATQRHKRSRI